MHNLCIDRQQYLPENEVIDEDPDELELEYGAVASYQFVEDDAGRIMRHVSWWQIG